MEDRKEDLKELITLAEEVKFKTGQSTLPSDLLQSVDTHVDELIDLASKEMNESENVVLKVTSENVFTPSADVLDEALEKLSTEEAELTEEEKEELARLQKITELKNLYKFKSTKDFGAKYKKDRKRKRRAANKSKKTNRRK